MPRRNILDFEKPVAELEKQIEEKRQASTDGSALASKELKGLVRKADKLRVEIFSNLTAWQIIQVARHPNRPYSMDYFSRVFDDFMELHGDRVYGDDPAIVGGLARLNGTACVVIGTQKGRTTKEKIFRNFGMPNPEGYRKGLRLMKLAERFDLPVITLIDTPGAYPGIGAEERGQAEAIAQSIQVMSCLRVPLISVIIGEGGSGGALALAVADTVMMLEYSTYSVISPEGCAAILWKDPSKSEVAARQLKLTANDLMEIKIIDAVVEEPPGGAHRNPAGADDRLKSALVESLGKLKDMNTDTLLNKRYEKFRKIGAFIDPMDKKQ